MKKKGLIIATIVMVLVLAVSLTTATYAWFTVASVTTIEGFDVSVVPNNAVNIGVKETYSEYVASGDNKTTWADFVYGDVVYTPGTAGVLGGSWTGSEGLGATLNHNIMWGAQKQAVGLTTATTATDAVPTNTTIIPNGADFTGKMLVAANGDTTKLQEQVPAVANLRPAVGEGSQATNGDYVHLVLGVQPTKSLKTNELIIMLDGSNSGGTIVGILSAVHVAYRVNNGAWVDDEFFADCDFDALLAEQTLTLVGYQKNAYEDSFSTESQSVTAPTTKASIVTIDLKDVALAQTDLAQVEIIIYIAGSDPQCVNAALNASGALKIFFATEDAAAQQG